MNESKTEKVNPFSYMRMPNKDLSCYKLLGYAGVNTLVVASPLRVSTFQVYEDVFLKMAEAMCDGLDSVPAVYIKLARRFMSKEEYDTFRRLFWSLITISNKLSPAPVILADAVNDGLVQEMFADDIVTEMLAFIFPVLLQPSRAAQAKETTGGLYAGMTWLPVTESHDSYWKRYAVMTTESTETPASTTFSGE